jgi:hypothetical protein
MLRIKKPRNFSWSKLLLASLLGTAGGIYIYQPLLEEHFKKEKAPVKEEAAAK